MKPGRHTFGFSLLELMVVVLLMAGLISIAVPSIRALTGVEIKSKITELAGMSQEVYDRAQLLGLTHRIAYNLDEGTFWTEAKNDKPGSHLPELGYEEIYRARLEGAKSADATEGDRFTPQFKKVEGQLGAEQTLGKKTKFHGVWTEDMSEVARSGLAFIYFFPGGYTQSAFVSISPVGEEEHAMYLSLSPLTGVPNIGFGEPDTNQLNREENELP